MDIYNYNCHIDASMVDNNALLRIDKLFDIFQIMLTEFLKQSDVDNVSIKSKYNAAWLITKVIINVNKLPIWGNNIKLKTYVVMNRPAKILLETIAIDDNDNILFSGIDEMCPIDLEKRRIIRLSEINYEPILIESINIETFNQINIFDMELIDTIRIKYNDIDFTNHTNNVSYIRFITNELGVEFFKKYDIKKLDVRYLKESRIGDELSIYRKNNIDNVIYLIKKDENNVFLIKIDYVEK